MFLGRAFKRAESAESAGTRVRAADYCLPHATATSLPTAAHQDHGTLGATLDVTARTPPKAAANRRNHKARLKAAAARADELTKRGQVTVIGDMIYQTGSMACDCAAERFEMQDGNEPHDMLDDDDYPRVRYLR